MVDTPGTSSSASCWACSYSQLQGEGDAAERSSQQVADSSENTDQHQHESMYMYDSMYEQFTPQPQLLHSSQYYNQVCTHESHDQTTSHF